MSPAEHRWLSILYVTAAGVAVLAVAHLSMLALLLALANKAYLYLGRPRGEIGPTALGHRRWMSRSIVLPLILYAALYGYLGSEVFDFVRHPSTGIWVAIAGHFVLHSAVTIFVGLWLIYRLLRGGLRFIDGVAV